MTDLRVLIVAADPLARSGLASLLTGQPGLEIAGQSDGSGDLAAEIEVYQPDVILYDLGWDATVLLERLQDLPAGGPPVLALIPEQDLIARVWPGLAIGALRRQADASRLMTALEAVNRGLAVLDPAYAASMREPPPAALPELEEALTPRELEVLRAVAEGLSNKAIALQLGISEHTVKFHVNTILGKLGAQSRTDAVVRATRLGLIAL